MKLNVMRNAKRNILFGVADRLTLILCPFITRTVIQLVLGAEYLGLNSLFSSIIKVLSLTELGLGTAVVYHMYKPVAEDDVATVCSLLNFYKKAYRRIGLLILIVGMALVPLLPYLIEGEYPKELNLVFLYMVYLFNTVVSYFMYAYMSSLLIVYQREDINSVVNMAVTLLLNITQVILLVVFHDYYLFLLTMPIFTIVNNLYTAFIVKRMFPQYHCGGVLPNALQKDIKPRIAGAFLRNICQISRNAFDSICISMFLGLTATAIYNNYYYIMHAIEVMLLVISSSFLGGIGNHVVVKSVEENFEELKKLDFFYMWISGWCTTCLLCLFQPFMKFWMGNEMLFPMPVVILFCIYFYLLQAGNIRSVYTNVNGLWWENRYRSLSEAAVNIILNFLLGKFFGIYGIMVATIITIFVCNFIWGVRITFKYYFQLSRIKEYYHYQIRYALVTFVSCVITYLICTFTLNNDTISAFLGRMLICVFVPNALYLLCYKKAN